MLSRSLFPVLLLLAFVGRGAATAAGPSSTDGTRHRAEPEVASSCAAAEEGRPPGGLAAAPDGAVSYGTSLLAVRTYTSTSGTSEKDASRTASHGGVGTGLQNGAAQQEAGLSWLVAGLLEPAAAQVLRIISGLPDSELPISGLPEVAVGRLKQRISLLGEGAETTPSFGFGGQPKVAWRFRNVSTPMVVVPVLLGFAMLLLMLLSFCDCGHRSKGDLARSPRQPGHHGAFGGELRPWSMLGIMALTSYRFYTGFLSATWMPYLLAMEGQQLMEERQSFFMGSAKLIYGMSILMNPMFGLVGDEMAILSHWSGRRLFIFVGVGASGLGIYGCLVAASIQSVQWYFVGIILWMLGEAMADVTTETLVPELLPREQYEISGAIRALNFLLGGLVGYAALILFRSVHYSWLYYGYLIVMIICAFLTLCLINTEDIAHAKSHEEPRQRETSIGALIRKAYYMPSHIEGGFPTACLCLFVFSLGSAPMFFLLLMVRDIIGITAPQDVQLQFAIISIIFFVSAAVASVVGAVAAGRSEEAQQPAPGARGVTADFGEVAGPEAAAGGAGAPPGVPRAERRLQEREALVQRWRLMVAATVTFGIVCLVIPVVGLVPGTPHRIDLFYLVAVAFGSAFGSVYARFQECTWSILPPKVDIANAMGFAAMCKLAGVGLGNFFAGIILDYYAKDKETYRLTGYGIMCVSCASVVFVSAALARRVGQRALASHDAAGH